MKVALLLIDLQNDFLDVPNLEPNANEIVERAANLLNSCRVLDIPIIHIWTTINTDIDNRMPHWQRNNQWRCVQGTSGHEVPQLLHPNSQEIIIHKTFYSGFENGQLEPILQSLEVDTLFLAGIYLHGCVRSTALDAYQKGFKVWIAEDSIGSDDPLHSAITYRYLEARAANFASVNYLLSLIDKSENYDLDNTKSPPLLPSIIADGNTRNDSTLKTFIHLSPRDIKQRLWQVPICGKELVKKAAISAKQAFKKWRNSPIDTRRQILHNLADLLEQERKSLVEQLAIEVGKPVIYGQAEVSRAIELLKSVALFGEEKIIVPQHSQGTYRYCPVGVVAIITPWNNPLAIPIGKIAPALLYGNTLIWKPALPGTAIAIKVMDLLATAGCPPGVINLVSGDHLTSQTLMSDENVDAVTLSGSSRAGYFAQDICDRRRIPLQAELGGNNAAIIWSDCDLENAAKQVIHGAFGFAGQRCTANRRVIVDPHCYDEFIQQLKQAMAELVWGDPLNLETHVGPLISLQKLDQVTAMLTRIKTEVDIIFEADLDKTNFKTIPTGAYSCPTIICCDHPNHEIIQIETFAPVLVVQKAENWEQAIQLCNGVTQGLVAALFSHSSLRQEQFLNEVQAGVLKLNSATTDVAVNIPFGGWKASGVGSPEHASSNREFYTRTQAIYNAN